VDVEHLHCTLGTEIHKDRVPARDATVVKRLRDAAAVILGTTVSTEYAIARAGPTRNPHNTGTLPAALRAARPPRYRRAWFRSPWLRKPWVQLSAVDLLRNIRTQAHERCDQHGRRDGRCRRSSITSARCAVHRRSPACVSCDARSWRSRRKHRTWRAKARERAAG